jgi:hypothetical protein
VVSDDYLGLSNTPTTFLIDREGIVRFEYRGKGSFDRPAGGSVAQDDRWPGENEEVAPAETPPNQPLQM